MLLENNTIIIITIINLLFSVNFRFPLPVLDRLFSNMTSSFLLYCCTLVLLLCSFSTLTSANEFFTHGNIKSLNEYALNAFVTASHKPVIVLFYAPWCGHCQRFKDDYMRLASLMGGSVRLGAIDGDKEGKLAQKFNVRGFPTILYWPMGEKTSDTRGYIEYQGPRTASALQKFVVSRLLKDRVIFAETAQDLTEVVMNSTHKQAAVFFSSRTHPPPLMTVMSYSKKLKELPFVFVNKAVSEMVGKEFGVEKIPSVAHLEWNEEESKMDLKIFQSSFTTYNSVGEFFLKCLEGEKTEGESTSPM